uniref:Uncharacterized protein n=1 Tax=Tetranychus urticae TaxID=32264 RepID=T1K2D3_TETUR
MWLSMLIGTEMLKYKKKDNVIGGCGNSDDDACDVDDDELNR